MLADGVRSCKECGAVKPLSDFHQSGHGGVKPRCAECCNASDRARMATPHGRETRKLKHEREMSKPGAREAKNAREKRRQAEKPAEIAAGRKDWKRRNREKVIAQHERARRRKGMGVRLQQHNAHVESWRRWQRSCGEMGPPWPPTRLMSDAEAYRWQYRNDPEFALNERLRRQFRKKAEAVPGIAELVRRALKDRGRSRIESLLGYTMADLREHLERQFVKGMSWEGYGKHGWHIDHILPRKCFDVATMDGLRAYWSLANLRPLAARENLRKLDRVEFLC